MDYTTELFHYGTIALTVSVNALSVGIGDGIVSLAALKAMNTQPSAQSEIFKTMLLGMALIETTAVIGLIVSLMLLPPLPIGTSEYAYYAELGIAFAICIAGGVVGYVSALPAQDACHSVARQPFFSRNIQLLMLLTQSLMQTPIIFAFIIALLIKGQLAQVTTLAESLRLIGSGLCIGVGSIGPSIGLALFSREVCKSVGINRQSYSQLFQFTLFSEALIESPVIFSLLVSLMVLTMRTQEPFPFIDGIGFLAASLAMGLGTLGPAISSGQVAARACKQIALTPQHYGAIAKTSFFAQALIETSAIYALIVAFAILFM